MNLDRQLKVIEPTLTRGAAGGIVTAWTDTGRAISAQLLSQDSREFRTASALRGETSHVFRIRYDRLLTGRHRVRFELQDLQVLGDPIEDTRQPRRKFMILSASVVGGQST